MTKSRVPEKDHGIQGEFNVKIYDQMQSRWESNWTETYQNKMRVKQNCLQGKCSNNALYLTAIPVRSIAAGELRRYTPMGFDCL